MSGGAYLERFSTFCPVYGNVWVTGHFGLFRIAHNEVLYDARVNLLSSECPMGALIFSSTLRCDFDTIFM